jgi:hypothetical protein
MRMAIDQFGREPVNHIVNREQRLFSRHLCIKQHLQQQISKLAGKFMPVTVVNRFQHFVGFFQRVRLDGIERLLAIPRATAGRAQPFHDFHRSFEAFSSIGHAGTPM